MPLSRSSACRSNPTHEGQGKRPAPFGPWTARSAIGNLGAIEPEGAVTAAYADPDALRCYRHQDRPTYVRCGRCEQPICPSCAMQGPVGLRCKACGTPANDPLTTFSPAQLAAGMAVALGGGTLGGMIGLQTGFFLSLCAGPFIGGLICEAVLRATGYKRGRLMQLLVVFGIVGGLLLAAVISSGRFMSLIGADPDVLTAYLSAIALSSVVYLIAATAGGLARLR